MSHAGAEAELEVPTVTLASIAGELGEGEVHGSRSTSKGLKKKSLKVGTLPPSGPGSSLLSRPCRTRRNPTTRTGRAC